MSLTVTQLTDRLIASYAKSGGINHLDGTNLPSKTAIQDITCSLLRLVFPGFFDDKPLHSSEICARGPGNSPLSFSPACRTCATCSRPTPKQPTTATPPL